MRIAWVVPGFQGSADEPGIPALAALAHALAQAHGLQVFSVRFPHRADCYRLGRVEVHSFGERPRHRRPVARRMASLWRWLRLLWAMRLAHHRAPFDVIHGWWATESGMLAALAGRLLGVPAVVSVAGGELAGARTIGYGGRTRPLEWAQVMLALHLATVIGVPSLDARRRLLVRAPWLRGRLRDLPLGYDAAIFAPAPWPGEGARAQGHIVCVASWTPVKGHDLLLDAAALLQARGVAFRLSLAGERTDGPEARAAVAARGLEGRVGHLGALSQPAVAALLGTADVMALASWHEAQCLAVVEALACGVPVVATPVGIARALLKEPALGVCIERRSPALLADALQAQLGRPGAEERRARQRRQEVVAHLALPAVAERLLAEYAELRER